MKTLQSALVIPLLAIAVTTFSGCSWFSSGSGEAEDGGLSEADLAAQREGRFGAGNIPTAEGEGMFRDIHFGFEANARVLSEQSSMKIILEGHCDERGTVEYNMALGAERARAVKGALVALGVPSSRIETISYGEEIPLDAGHSEDAYARNRRVHFSIGGNAPAAAGRSSKY